MDKRKTKEADGKPVKRLKIQLAAFTDAENNFLIEHCAKFFYNCSKKKDRLLLLNEMEKKMTRAGFRRDYDEIERRLNNMRQQYKALKKDGNAGFSIKWKHFDAIDEIMKGLEGRMEPKDQEEAGDKEIFLNV